MSTLFVIGIGVWMIGAGVSKLPNTGYIGGITQVVGGILVVITPFV